MSIKHTYTLLGLALLGFLFSGYYAATKFFTDTCAFGETCPYFLGYPACYYGFGMFTVLFVTSLVAAVQGADRCGETGDTRFFYSR